MNSDIRRWCLSAGLASALVVGMGATVARGQYLAEPPPGSRADQREDGRAAQRLRAQLWEDHQRLWAHLQQYGRGNPQVRADRRQLRYDQRRLRALRRDMRYDRRIQEGREDGWR